jgi:hypothetical protein
MTNDPIMRAGSEISPVYNQGAMGEGVLSQPKQPNKFMSVLKGVGGAALSMIPGVGGMLGGLLGGGGPNMGNMHAMMQQQQRFSMQLLQVQQQVSSQSQEFTSVSNLLKARHDSEMSAVNNFKS